MYELKNYCELQVKKALEEYLPKANIPCKCERCQADILAFTLNRLPPRYYVSEKGEFITSVETQLTPDKTRIISEIVAATQVVAAYPSHPID
ncbi:MAG: late competence development ComFB family protein [Eubacteriales bacterium]